MVAPIFRRWTRAAPAALDTFALATDDITALGFYSTTRTITMQDMVSDPAPAAGIRYEIRLLKNGIPTGRSWFSASLDPASAGRVAIGPIDILGPTNINFDVAQRAGALAAYNFLTKFSGV